MREALLITNLSKSMNIMSYINLYVLYGCLMCYSSFQPCVGEEVECHWSLSALVEYWVWQVSTCLRTPCCVVSGIWIARSCMKIMVRSESHWRKVVSHARKRSSLRKSHQTWWDMSDESILVGSTKFDHSHAEHIYDIFHQTYFIFSDGGDEDNDKCSSCTLLGQALMFAPQGKPHNGIEMAEFTYVLRFVGLRILPDWAAALIC